jgi:hypothetical protein
MIKESNQKHSYFYNHLDIQYFKLTLKLDHIEF